MISTCLRLSSRLLANRTILLTVHAVPKLDEITQPGSTGQLRDEERRRWEEMVAEAEIIMKELRALLKKGDERSRQQRRGIA